MALASMMFPNASYRCIIVSLTGLNGPLSTVCHELYIRVPNPLCHATNVAVDIAFIIIKLTAKPTVE
jgi:hypothetical protein